MTDLLDSAQSQIDTAASVSAGTPPTPPAEPVNPFVANTPSSPIPEPPAPLPVEPPPAPPQPAAADSVQPVNTPRINADLPKDESPTVVVPPPPAPPEEKKQGMNKVLVGAVIAILLAVVPISAYFLSNRSSSLTENRSKAANTGQPCSPDGAIECQDDNLKHWCDPATHTWSSGGDACVFGETPTCVISGYSCGTDNQCYAMGGGVCGTAPNQYCCNTVTTITNCPNSCGQAPITCPASGVPSYSCGSDNKCYSLNGGICGTGAGQYCCNLEVDGSNCGGTCGGTGPTPTPGGGGNCAHATDSCESVSCCTGENLVCQGASGSRVCQQTAPGGSGDAWCMSDTNNPGFGCVRYQSYQCTALTNGQCLQNKDESHTTWADAMSRANATGCGQADMVCREGIHDGELCGDFVIYDANCGPGTTFNPNPSPTNPPQLTQPPAGPQCTAIFVYDSAGIDITPTLRDGTKTLMPGDAVTLATTKGTATRARFRFQGLTNFEETTQTRTEGGIVQFYVTTTVPTTITTTSATVEVEVTIDGTTWN